MILEILLGAVLYLIFCVGYNTASTVIHKKSPHPIHTLLSPIFICLFTIIMVISTLILGILFMIRGPKLYPMLNKLHQTKGIK